MAHTEPAKIYSSAIYNHFLIITTQISQQSPAEHPLGALIPHTLIHILINLLTLPIHSLTLQKNKLFRIDHALKLRPGEEDAIEVLESNREYTNS
jgi:hypothetical protein